MIKAHIPTEQYGFFEVDYKTIDDVDTNYVDDYIAIKTVQRDAIIKLKKLNDEKNDPK